MEKNIDWIDLYIKDFGSSQVEDKKELFQYQKKMKTFYREFLSPLYVHVQNNKKFKFSVPDDELTCRIMLEDLRTFLKLETMTDILRKIAENRPGLTEEKIQKLIEAMKKKRESAEAKKR